MRHLGIALLNYESAYQAFPPATRNIGGNTHSWRTQILPFMEQDRVYQAYDFSMAWDSTKNLTLANKSIDLFQCPRFALEPKTPYKLVVGPGTLFESGIAPQFSQATDGPENTIILIEDPTNHVFWSEPKDISVEEAAVYEKHGLNIALFIYIILLAIPAWPLVQQIIQPLHSPAVD